MVQQLSLRTFPHAIIHVDADSFFASCEQAVNHNLKGKPVVTGKERGICSAASYEAKALGVKRGMPLHEIRKVCPECIIVPSDYETYSLFSMRMFDIVRRYTSEVEEYSIDECFADITGLRRPLRMSYPDIARKIKQDLDTELGMTFSIGLAPTKVLGKVGSKWDKPSGLVVIPARKAHEYLARLRTDEVWGIGAQTAFFLAKHGIHTAYQLAARPREWVESHLAKPYREIWYELNGTMVNRVEIAPHTDYQSISKTKTFTPPSRDAAFVFAQLAKNIENACIKARRHGLASKRIAIFLKRQDFRYRTMELILQFPVSTPGEILRGAREEFQSLFRPSELYRATGVVLLDLVGGGIQKDIFGEYFSVEKRERAFGAVDTLAKKFGKHTVFSASSFDAHTHAAHAGDRGDLAARRKNILPGETKRRHLNVPIIGEVG